MNRSFSAAFLRRTISWGAAQAANECCAFGAKQIEAMLPTNHTNRRKSKKQGTSIPSR